MTKNKRMVVEHESVEDSYSDEHVTRLKSDGLPIRLITHNIRYATKSPFKGEEVWEIRAPRLINELRYHTLYNNEAFICLQEVLDNQLIDILRGLNDNEQWKYIGVGRDDGKKAGEYSPILYRPAVWDLQEFKTIWLSETSDRPSKGWDAASTRIVTVGKFKHRKSGRVLVAMSTHLDDQGSRSRYESAKIIAKQAEDAAPLPVFVAGDFNSEPGQEAYMVLSAPESPVHDLIDLTPSEAKYGHQYTFTGFGHEGLDRTRIDFVFLSKGEDWEAKGYSILESRFEDGVFNSDHRAVVGDVLLKIKS